MSTWERPNARETGKRGVSNLPTQVARCETCRSTKLLEPDIDNPGVFYCKSCWEEYDKLSETRRQIENNDPDLKELVIGRDRYQVKYHPPDGDWTRDGKAIGSNLHIKELRFAYNTFDKDVRRDNVEAFCEGLANNKSIERLRIDQCECFGGEILNIISPLLEQNPNLCCLAVRWDFASALNVARRLSELLSRFNTLREFDFYRGRLRDDNVEALLRALVGHFQLIKIDLSENQVGAATQILP